MTMKLRSLCALSLAVALVIGFPWAPDATADDPDVSSVCDGSSVEDDRDGRLKNGMPVTVLMEAIEASEAAASR